MRTWGIAGELVSARWPTDLSNQSGRWFLSVGAWDGASRGRTGICYKKNSWQRPVYMRWRLIYAKKRGQEAPLAYKYQTDQSCHQKLTR